MDVNSYLSLYKGWKVGKDPECLSLLTQRWIKITKEVPEEGELDFVAAYLLDMRGAFLALVNEVLKTPHKCITFLRKLKGVDALGILFKIENNRRFVMKEGKYVPVIEAANTPEEKKFYQERLEDLLGLSTGVYEYIPQISSWVYRKDKRLN